MHCILERREHTAVANTHVVGDITTECKPPRRGRFTLKYIEASRRFVCRRSGCSVKWHGKIDTVGCRSNGSYGVHQEKACGERLSDNDLRTHSLHWYVPPLSCTHTLTSHDSPESSRTHRLSAGRRHTHMCSSHPTLRTSKKQKMSRTFYFSSHVTHLYYYSCGECSLGIVYCTLTKRSGARTH